MGAIRKSLCALLIVGVAFLSDLKFLLGVDINVSLFDLHILSKPQHSFLPIKKLDPESCPIKIFVYERSDSAVKLSNVTMSNAFHSTYINDGQSTYFLYTDPQPDKSRFMLVFLLKFFYASPCRTKSPDEADFFLVPTLTSAVGEHNTIMREIEIGYNNTLVRRGGRDHIIASLWNVDTGCKAYTGMADDDFPKYLLSPMLKVVAETFSWGFPFRSRHVPMQCGLFRYANILAVPYISTPHSYTGDVHRRRQYLAMFVGNTNYPKYRNTLSEQCNAAMNDKGDCYAPNKERKELLAKVQTFDVYVNSTFFFCPSGDTPTRKALFDGLALNSIPVLFEELSLDLQYAPFFPGNPRDYSLLLNSTDDVMGQLRAIPQSTILEMQSNIERIRESLTYVDRVGALDSSWVIMQQLREYKANGYQFSDPFANKTTVSCVKEMIFRDACLLA